MAGVGVQMNVIWQMFFSRLSVGKMRQRFKESFTADSCQASAASKEFLGA